METKIKKLDKIDEDKISIVYQNKGYRILLFGKKYKFITESCKIPFGVEKYGNKEIINLEFDTLNDNDQLNYSTTIKYIDSIFAKIKKESKIYMPPGFKKKMENKYFSLSTKERGYGKVHHRCYMKNGGDFSILSIDNIKVLNVCAEIELDHLWIHNDMYGIVWLVTALYCI